MKLFILYLFSGEKSREERSDSFTTFHGKKRRFLSKLRSNLYICGEHLCLRQSIDEFLAGVSVIEGNLSQNVQKDFCTFSLKPIDKIAVSLYIVDTKKKGVIPVKK